MQYIEGNFDGLHDGMNYVNIVSPDLSYRRFSIIGKYNTLDEAKENLAADWQAWKKNHKGIYSYATISIQL